MLVAAVNPPSGQVDFIPFELQGPSQHGAAKKQGGQAEALEREGLAVATAPYLLLLANIQQLLDTFGRVSLKCRATIYLLLVYGSDLCHGGGWSIWHHILVC